MARSQVCGNAMHHLSGAKKKATKIQYSPEIIAVRDGLYCRVNFTVRLAVHNLLSGWTSVPHNGQLQRITPFSDHQSYPTLYSNDNVVSLIFIIPWLNVRKCIAAK